MLVHYSSIFHMKNKFRIYTCGAIAFGLLLFWGYANSESVCFFDPNIDTRYAPGYNEAAFNQVTIGMTPQSVEQLAGKPLIISTETDSTQVWAYSTDGKAPFGDWAWMCRTVVFRNGKVAEVLHMTAYD
jgi:hypothetical protein